MSDVKAGQIFKCVCCLQDEEEHNATYDRCLKGPVCPECNFNLVVGALMLKHFHIHPCIGESRA